MKRELRKQSIKASLTYEDDVTNQAFPGGDTHGLSIEDLADGYMSELESRMKRSSVTSSRSITASISIPSDYSKYYHVGTQEDVDNWGIGGTIESNIIEIQDELNHCGYADYRCIGIAFANDDYYDALCTDGLDFLYIIDDPLCPICILAGRRLIPVEIGEIQRLTVPDKYHSRYTAASKVVWKLFIVSNDMGNKMSEKVSQGTATSESAALKDAQNALKTHYSKYGDTEEVYIEDLHDVEEFYEDSYNEYEDNGESYLTTYYDPIVTIGGEYLEYWPVITLDYYE